MGSACSCTLYGSVEFALHMTEMHHLGSKGFGGLLFKLCSLTSAFVDGVDRHEQGYQRVTIFVPLSGRWQ